MSACISLCAVVERTDDYALLDASRKIEKEKSPVSKMGSVVSLLSRLNGKLQVRRVCAARVDDVLPTVGADVLFDPGHQRSQQVS
jgi:hypothetical protein